MRIGQSRPRPGAAARWAPAVDARRGGTFRTWKTTEDQGLDSAVFHTNNGEVTQMVYNHLLDLQVSKGTFSMDGAVGYEQVDDTTLVWAPGNLPGARFVIARIGGG